MAWEGKCSVSTWVQAFPELIFKAVQFFPAAGMAVNQNPKGWCYVFPIDVGQRSNSVFFAKTDNSHNVGCAGLSEPPEELLVPWLQLFFV